MHPTILALLLALAPPTTLLDLEVPTAASGLPAGWEVRPVKGQPAPDYEVLNLEDGGRALRLSGRGVAAWATHKLEEPLAPTAGRLGWSWRVIEQPDSADLRDRDADDSAIRVYVVFGNPRKLFGGSGRIVFYTWGNAEPDGLTMPSHVSDRLHIVRAAGAAEVDGDWHAHEVDPFEDYRRLWDREPPPITAVGVMQDTDMTGSLAVADLRDLTWTPGP
ncbi:MAG: DUF3047 domain-containing protein [Gemmatimonadales bacterium]